MHRLETHIDQKWGFLKESTVFVGCSGGLDSIVLVSLLKKQHFNVRVLHVNYQLRGEDSEKDAVFVCEFCQKMKVPFQQKTIDLGAVLSTGGNLQELARNVRYNWFLEEVDKVKDAYIAVAHHQNDQIETFFLNLSRNAGVMGLASMLEQDSRTIRPLLPFSKEEITAYAIEKNIRWREDRSNESNKYRRNFLRNKLIPLLKLQIPSIEKSVLTLVAVMQETQRQLAIKMKEELSKIVTQNKMHISTFLGWNDIERIELFRQLKQSASLTNELINIAAGENGKRVLMNNHPLFSSIVKQNEDFIFVKHENISMDRHLEVCTVENLPTTFAKDKIYVDPQKMEGELKLRRWKDGDRIHPVGMKGSKLISDCIKDAHVPIADKSSVLVLCDDVNIHWCVGIVVGRKAIANSNTVNIQCVSLAP